MATQDSVNKRPHTEVSEESLEEEKTISDKLTEVTDKLNNFSRLFDQLFLEIKEIKTTVQTIQQKVYKNDDLLVNVNKTVKENVKDIEDIKTNFTNFNAEINRLQRQLKDQQKKSIELEAQSRRNNLLFFNIPEGDKDENCHDVISDVIRKEFKMKGEFPLHRAHRLGPRRRNDSSRKKSPRPIIVAFVNHQEREAVRSARHKLRSRVNIAEDFPAPIRKARETLIPELRAVKDANRQATIAFPARLIVDGQVVKEVDFLKFI